MPLHCGGRLVKSAGGGQIAMSLRWHVSKGSQKALIVNQYVTFDYKMPLEAASEWSAAPASIGNVTECRLLLSNNHHLCDMQVGWTSTISWD